MLSKIALETARELAEELERRRVTVTPLLETPLDGLVEAGLPVEEGELPNTIETAVESLDINTVVVDSTSAINHDTQMSSTVANIVSVLDRRLDLARNKINPLATKYEEMIIAEMASIVPETPTITEVNYGEFYDHPLVKDIFSGWGYTDTDKLFGLSGIQFNDENNYHIEALTTGSQFIDDKLKSILDTRGEEWYRTVANKYFTEGAEVNVLTPSLDEAYQEQADENLVTHMLARYFYNKHEPQNDMSQSDYDIQLLKVLGRTALNANGLLKYKTTLERDGIVVPDIANESNHILVYGPTYRDYLNKGGNNTALMGYSRTKGKVLNVDKLIEQTASLEQLYDKEVDQTVRQLRSDRLRIVKRAAYTRLPEIIQEIPDEVLAVIPEINSDPRLSARQVLLDRGTKFIDAPSVIDLDNVYQYALNIITLGLLPELELHSLYNSMMKYLQPSENGPALTPAQAAYYAVLEEVVQYFLSQTSLSGR